MVDERGMVEVGGGSGCIVDKDGEPDSHQQACYR